MFKPLAVAAALLLAAAPALAQEPGEDAESVRAQVAAFVQPTHEARTEAAMALARSYGFEPEIETFQGGPDGAPREGRNVTFVVHTAVGEGPYEPEILLVAHYDAVELEDGVLAHGVVDNAASVVAVVRAAAALRLQHLNRDIRVVLFDQEELGLIGARRWIETHGLQNVAAVVNSDVAAYGDTMMYGQNNGEQSALVTQVVRMVCAETALSCVGYPNYPPSDDRAFSAAGAAVVSLGFQDEIGAHQMWLAFNAPQGASGLAPGFVPQVFRLIHSADDTMEAVDPETVLLAAATYAEIAIALARTLPERSGDGVD